MLYVLQKKKKLEIGMFLSTEIDQNIRYHLSENSNAVVMFLLLYVSFSRTK